MSIRVVCPSCDKVYNLDENMEGKKVVCRECKAPITVSAGRLSRNDDRPSRDERTTASRPGSSAGRFRRDDDDDEPRRRPAERSRDDDDEPRRRPAERSRERDRDRGDEPRRDRRSGRSRDDDSGKKNMVPIIIGICVGAVALIGLGIGGVIYIFSGTNTATPAVAAAVGPVDAGPGAGAGGAGPGAGAGAEGPAPNQIAPNVVADVKKSTVYLRVNLPNRGVAQGSGFFALEKGIVITNAHVLGMLRADSLAPRNVDVVVNSGEPNETKMTGTVLGVDRDNDLAVLRVEGDASRLPPPLPVESAGKLGETQKLYIFGFPFGAQLGKSITVSDSAVSSLRRDANGILKQVQVNGGMNSGNSGGPVTDTRGVVVGVSVAGIPGTNINFAIPGDFVKDVINGKVTNTETGFAYRAGGESRLPVRLSCLDPMNRVREVKVDVWTGPAGAALPASSASPAARPGDGPRQSYSLAIKEGKFAGEVVLPSALAGQVVWIQPMAVGGNGTQWDKSMQVPAELLNPIERKAATIQFKAPTSAIERTLKLNSKTNATIYKGSTSMNFEDALESTVLEALQPEEGKGTRVRLGIGPLTYTSRAGDRVIEPPAQALNIVRQSPAAFIISPTHVCVTATKQHFRTLRSPHRDAVVEVYQTLTNTYEGTIVPVPNRAVQPQETWPTRMPMYVFRNGKLTVQDIFLDCTFEGVATEKGRSEACISLKGRVKGRGPLNNVELGKVSGHAHVDIDAGYVTRVKLTTITELENEDKGARILVHDVSSVERTEGNSLGLTLPSPGPIAKNNPPDRTKPGGPTPGGTLQQDLAALKGTWQSGDFNAGSGITGVITLQFNPATGRPGGQVKVDITAKRGAVSASSATTVSFTLSQQGDNRRIVGMNRRKHGLAATYQFDGDQLVLTGNAATLRATVSLNRVSLRRTSGVAGDLAGKNLGGFKFSGDVNDFVQEAVDEGRLIDVDVTGFKLSKDVYRDLAPDGGVLIGFQVGLGKFGPNSVVKALRPIYQTKKGEQLGKWYGKAPASPVEVKAKPGYVVSGITIRTGLGIDGFTVTFAKLGKDRVEMDDNYNGKPAGGEGGSAGTIGGKGALFVGVTGHLGGDKSPSSLGLVAVLPKN
jgi:S1-C subfamily serine protease